MKSSRVTGISNLVSTITIEPIVQEIPKNGPNPKGPRQTTAPQCPYCGQFVNPEGAHTPGVHGWLCNTCKRQFSLEVAVVYTAEILNAEIDDLRERLIGGLVEIAREHNVEAVADKAAVLVNRLNRGANVLEVLAEHWRWLRQGLDAETFTKCWKRAIATRQNP